MLYPAWAQVRDLAARHLADADAAMVTSFCPDGIEATDLVLQAPRPLHVFYDLDTPVTLERLQQGQSLSYIGPRGLADFDIVLSYTGGGALDALRDQLGARIAVPLYGHVDPDVHRPAAPRPEFAGDLSYIGTYAPDRQAALEALLVDPARQRPDLRFVIAGAQYPDSFPWSGNIFFLRHLAPPDHPGFYASSRLTLNVTRHAMAEMGWCPSGRLFEAAACGAPVLSDAWPGFEEFFTPGREILLARGTDGALAALDLPEAELRRIGAAARERVLDEHTSARRAAELEALLASARAATKPIAMEA